MCVYAGDWWQYLGCASGNAAHMSISTMQGSASSRSPIYTERLRRVQWWKRRRHGTRPVQCLPSMSACCSCRRHWRRSSGAPHSLTCHHQPRDSLAEVLRMRSSLYKSRDSSKSLECSRYKHQVKLPRSVYLSHMLIAVTQACRICGDIELLQ